MKVRLWLTSIFNVLDLTITMILVNIYGIGIELNPFGRFLFNNNLLLFFYKFVIVSLCLLILWKYHKYTISKLGAWLVFMVYTILIIYQLMGLILLFT